MLLVDVLTLEEKLPEVFDSFVRYGTQLGWTLLKAVLVFVVGRLLISAINSMVRKILSKQNIDSSVKSFVGSLVNVVLIILLIISVIGALGVQTASFAALLASAGVAIGMALSGNLSNFAGGLIILLLKPYKVGDYIDALTESGTVKEVQIFHTVLNTSDNRLIYIPNASLSSGIVVNYSKQDLRRVDWVFGVEYGTDFGRVKGVLEEIIAKDSRILSKPAGPFIALNELADSSVNVTVRVWVKSADYWGVYFDMNRNVYETFNKVGIGFPYPQVTVHQAKG